MLLSLLNIKNCSSSLLLASYIVLLTIKGTAQSVFHPKENHPEKITRYGVTVDQDYFVEDFGLPGRNEDRNYTMGVGFFLANNYWAGARLFAPFRWIAKMQYRNRKDDIEFVNGILQAGVSAFSPEYLGDNITDSLYYMVNDRPFSSLTFLSLKYVVGSTYKVETNQLVLGVLGLGIAREVQTYVHKKQLFGSTRPVPYGWKNQLSNCGEPSLLLSNRMDKLLSKGSYDDDRTGNLNTQFIFSREYRLGYYTGASAGMAMRIGLLDPDNWVAYDSYQLGFVNANVPKLRRLKGELYFQASVRPQLVLYNAHLMGQFKKNFHDFSFSEIEQLVIEGFMGLGATIPNAKKNFSVNLMAYLSGRSPEFKTDLSYRSHIWGGVQVAFTRIKPQK